MTWNGVKKVFQASAPLFVFADTDIFAKAPARLTAAGVSDILGAGRLEDSKYSYG